MKLLQETIEISILHQPTIMIIIFMSMSNYVFTFIIQKQLEINLNIIINYFAVEPLLEDTPHPSIMDTY